MHFKCKNQGLFGMLNILPLVSGPIEPKLAHPKLVFVRVSITFLANYEQNASTVT